MAKTTPEKLEWQKGTPKQPGSYLIAIAYKNGLGTIDCDTWDYELGWGQKNLNIVGYIPLRDVIRFAAIEFPEHLAE